MLICNSQDNSISSHRISLHELHDLAIRLDGLVWMKIDGRPILPVTSFSPAFTTQPKVGTFFLACGRQLRRPKEKPRLGERGLRVRTGAISPWGAKEAPSSADNSQDCP